MSQPPVLPQNISNDAEDREPTPRDILLVINKFSTDMDKKIDAMDRRLSHIENVMVTKDYLDNKLFDLKGDLMIVVRKEDRKVVALTEELVHTNVLSAEAAQRILCLGPFPQ